MRGAGYILLVALVVGCWIIWQVMRRISAGAQAFINPERYAIHKIESMAADAAAQPIKQRAIGQSSTSHNKPIKATWSDWITQGDEIVRQYDFKEVPQSGDVMIQIRCRLEAGLSIHSFIFILAHPFRHFQRETFIPAFLGTEDGLHECFFTAYLRLGNDDLVFFDIPSPQDARKCLEILYAGTDMIFRVFGKSETMLSMPLPNDSQFSKSHLEIYDRLKKRYQ